MKQPTKIKLPKINTDILCKHLDTIINLGDGKGYVYKTCAICGFSWKYFSLDSQISEKLDEVLNHENKIISSKKFVYNMELLYSILQDIAFPINKSLTTNNPSSPGFDYFSIVQCGTKIKEAVSISYRLVLKANSIASRREFDIDLTNIEKDFDRIKSLIDELNKVLDKIGGTFSIPNNPMLHQTFAPGMQQPIYNTGYPYPYGSYCNNPSTNAPNQNMGLGYGYIQPAIYGNNPLHTYPQQSYTRSFDYEESIKSIIEKIDSMPSDSKEYHFNKLKRVQKLISDKLDKNNMQKG